MRTDHIGQEVKLPPPTHQQPRFTSPLLDPRLLSPLSLERQDPVSVGYHFGDGIEKVYPDWKESFEGNLAGAKVVAFGHGWCHCEMVVERHHTNFNGFIHGGASMSIVDTVGTIAVKTMPEAPSDQTSVDISTSFLGPAQEGDVLLIECTVKKLGRTFAFIHVRLVLSP